MLAPLLQKKKIWQCQTPIENVHQGKQVLARGRQKYRHLFKDDEQCDLFTMLPIPEDKRLTILQNMIEDSQFHNNVRTCTGAEGTSSEHRRFCIDCVLKYKPALAKSYY
jgi:hypothetical protein